MQRLRNVDQTLGQLCGKCSTGRQAVKAVQRSGLAVKELVEGERIVWTRTLHQVAESIGSEDVAVELGAL